MGISWFVGTIPGAFPGAHTVPVAVLAFDSDDAEEQAEAITGAIRSRGANRDFGS